MTEGTIQNLVDYKDFIKKSRYNFDKFCKEENTYNFLDCILTLNAIPEWIIDSEAPEKLQDIAKEKLQIMKTAWDNELNSLETIDEKLMVIRLISNHSKHNASQSFPKVSFQSGMAFPITFPAKFSHLSIGDKTITAKGLLLKIIEFWENEILEELQ